MLMGPTYSLIKQAFSPGDAIYVLNENEEFEPVKITRIEKSRFLTKKGEVLFADYGWLWKALPQKN